MNHINKKSVGIIGGGGYTAGELIRLLVHHPEVDIKYIYSQSQAGKHVYEVHSDMLTHPHLTFSHEPSDADVVFLCQGHGKAKAFLEKFSFSEETIIIDLGNDHRIENKEWIYGLPELQKDAIKNATRIANCGCFATAIQLACLPLAANGMLTSDIHVSAITGSTGAGQNPSTTTHFSWRNNNVSIYKAFSHQHEAEVYQSIHVLQKNYSGKIWFLPHRGNFSRGILASIYTPFSGSQEDAYALYNSFYEEHPFAQATQSVINLKQVVNTNHCFLRPTVSDGMILIESILDNLLKGASGQAVQNMNLALGYPEETGLLLKSIAY